MEEKIRRHIRSNVVGYLALFVALSGTAYAANTVFSEDIVDGEVMTQDIATNAVTSGKIPQGAVLGSDIADGEVRNHDLANNAVSSAKIANGQVRGVDVMDDDLTGLDIDESTLSGGNAGQLDGHDSTAFPRTFARADDSFAPGPGSRLDVNVTLGALIGVTCDDGGTPGADGDDTVSIDVLNLDPNPFQVFIERVTAPGNTSGVSGHSLSRLELSMFTSAGSTPAPISTHRFYISPPGDSQTTIVAEATGMVLPGGSDNCAGVIQATRSN